MNGVAIVLPQRLTKQYIRKQHQVKKIGKFYTIATYDFLDAKLKTEKWYMMVKRQVEAVFNILNNQVRSHKIKKLLQKKYAELMYKHMFELQFTPTEVLLEFLDYPSITPNPSCLAVEINPERLIGMDKFNNTMFEVIRSSVLYLKIIREWYRKEGLPIFCDGFEEGNSYGMREFIDEILPSFHESKKRVPNAIEHLQQRWLNWERYIRKLSVELNRPLNIYQEDMVYKVKLINDKPIIYLSFQPNI